MVYLIGAGPGAAGLLTLRGKECLEGADFVLYDQLVSPQILEVAPATAEKVCVTALASCHPERWPHIHTLLIDEARKGKCVVRLKGGDPLVFGRGGEEAEALRAAGIPYEIVPGVTAALAAGSYLEIPLTHRALASAVAFITGHEDPGKPLARIDWKAVAEFPGTLVIYMGFSKLPSIVAELIHHGKAADTPAAAIAHASTGEQRSVTSTLAKLEDTVRAADLTTPALVLIGPVVGLKPPQSWFEARPLLGKCVLVTRPARQAAGMIRELELLGAIPLLLPAVEVRDPPDWSPVDAAQHACRTGGFDWLVFTSANGVDMFMKRLKHQGRDVRALGSVKLAAIGPSSAEALRAYHLEPEIVPKEPLHSEQLIERLKVEAAGQRVLIAQADRARDLVREQLAAIAQVQAVTVYSQVEVVDVSSAVFDRLRQGEVDYVTFTSPNIARAVLGRCDQTIAVRFLSGEVRIVTNSPRASATVRDLGFPVAAESHDPTVTALLNELIQLRVREQASG